MRRRYIMSRLQNCLRAAGSKFSVQGLWFKNLLDINRLRTPSPTLNIEPRTLNRALAGLLQEPHILIFLLSALLIFALDASAGQSAVVQTTTERATDPVMEAVNQQKPHDQRIAAVEHITDLSAPGAQKAMIDYLLQPSPGMDGDQGAEYELRNNMLNKLREHSSDPRAVTETILKIYRDPGQGDVLRAYAVQHISGWIRTGALATGDREQLLAAVRDAATKVDNPVIGGAGLIALREAGTSEEAGAFAMDALRSKSACPESRISAFQVCAELGVTRALEPARAALADRTAPVVLRMSAVNVLAKLGGSADERLLQELSTGSSGKISKQSAEQNIKAGRPDNDELVRNAARLALAKKDKSERK